MIESFVDLTYRGLSLGRRIRLSQVRPSTGYLELPAPMPVGAQIAIVADDGTAFEATVTGVHEQVGGSDRTPGMIVAPALATEPAAAWWKARVTLSEDDALRPRSATAGGRSRPPTVRPRSHTDPMPPAPGAPEPAEAATTDEVPTIIADLDARVMAAAGVAPARPDGDRGDMRTIVMPLAEIEALAAASSDATGDLDPAILQRTGEHDVVDDGKRTMIMAPVDPVALGIDPAAPGAAAAIAVAQVAAADARAHELAAAAGDAAGPDDGDGDGGGDDHDPGDTLSDAPSDTLKDTPTAQPPGGRRKRRSRR